MDVTATLTAVDEQGERLPLPDWLSFEWPTRTFAGTPPDPAAPPFQVLLTFAGDGPSFFDQMTIDPADSERLTTGIPYVPRLLAYHANPGVLTAELWTGQPLPDWLTFDPDTAEFPKDHDAAFAGR